MYICLSTAVAPKPFHFKDPLNTNETMDPSLIGLCLRVHHLKRVLLLDLSVHPSVRQPISLYCSSCIHYYAIFLRLRFFFNINYKPIKCHNCIFHGCVKLSCWQNLPTDIWPDIQTNTFWNTSKHFCDHSRTTFSHYDTHTKHTRWSMNSWCCHSWQRMCNIMILGIFSETDNTWPKLFSDPFLFAFWMSIVRKLPLRRCELTICLPLFLPSPSSTRGLVCCSMSSSARPNIMSSPSFPASSTRSSGGQPMPSFSSSRSCR